MMGRNVYTGLLLIALGTTTSRSEGFVEEVSCASNSMTIVINKSDPGVLSWVLNPEAQPVVYVDGFKTRTPCGVALKGPNGKVSYNLTIPYGPACSVLLTDLEPNYQTGETTIAIEDNNESNPAKPIRMNHVFCLYTRSIQAIRINDISTGHQVVASTGGKPKPKVKMNFLTEDGRPLRAAKFGDTVKLSLELDKDNAYKAIAPKECMFSDHENMKHDKAKKLTFVQSHCPVAELREIIEPMQDINEEVYFSKFRTFRFGNQSTVYAHCTVQVCLDQANCLKRCYGDLESETRVIAGRGVIREKRSAEDAKEDEVEITNALTVLDEQETIAIAGRSEEICFHTRTASAVQAALLLLGGLFLVSLSILICIALRLRNRAKGNEGRMLASPSLPPPSLLVPYDSMSRSGACDREGSEIGSQSAESRVNGTVRSISEMTVPGGAWVSAFPPTGPPHSIPRIQHFH